MTNSMGHQSLGMFCVWVQNCMIVLNPRWSHMISHGMPRTARGR